MTDDSWTAQGYEYSPRAGNGKYRNVRVTSPSGKEIEITESPTGRTIHIYVDGEPWERSKKK